MEFKSSEHQRILIDSYKLKLNVFHHLVQQYKSLLHRSLDGEFCSGIGFTIGIIQDSFRDEHETSKKKISYDFYRDSNISEIQPTIVLLQRLKQRISEELKQWPDHPVLNDVKLFPISL